MPKVPTADIWQETQAAYPLPAKGELARPPWRGPSWVHCDLGIDERLDACKMRRSGMKW